MNRRRENNALHPGVAGLRSLPRILTFALVFVGLAAAEPVSAHASSALSSEGAPIIAKLPVLRVSVFDNAGPVIWTLSLIQRAGIDVRHGFKLVVARKPGNVAYSDFLSGADPACYCLAVATGARFVEQGADVSLLWNFLSYDDYQVITGDPTTHGPEDLIGKTIGGDTGAANWALATYFLKQQGVDLSKVKIRSVASNAQVPELAVGRVDAIQTNPTNILMLQTSQPGRFRTFSIFDRESWRKRTGQDAIPMFQFGVRGAWIRDPTNLDLVKRFYAANFDAAAFMREKPDETANLIADEALVPKQLVVAYLKKYPATLDVKPIGDYRKAISVQTQELLPEAKLLDRPLTNAEFRLLAPVFDPHQP